MVMQISIRAPFSHQRRSSEGTATVIGMEILDVSDGQSFFHGRRVDKSSIQLFRSVVITNNYYTFTPNP